MKYLLILFLGLGIAQSSSAQAEFDITDQEAFFPGGEVAMRKFVRDNLNYPEIAIEKEEQGTVYVSFVVEKDGSLSQIKIARGVSESLDKEAIRLVKKMPNWIPGEVKAVKVLVRQNLPLNFKLV
ncbi:MAG: protein TonB [Flavobacteriaceae bacterium]|jgi:protein TonB